MSRSRDSAADHARGTAPSVAPNLDAEHQPGVARRASLAALRAIQKKGAGLPTEAVHDAAARGIASPTTALPFASEIQSSFGAAYDLSGIKAHVGGDAAQAMGARAFAAGEHVVFDGAPDLHTAAHEAAHVVQQARGVNLYGGVGEAGDAYEQHADAVADRVVAGQPAGALLQAGPGGAAPDIQRAPSQAQADQSVIHAIQAHMKLSAARMYAASARVFALLEMDTHGPAGVTPMLMGIELEVRKVNADLDALAAEVNRDPQLVKGALDVEARLLRGAIHDTHGWAAALGKVYSFVHDAQGTLKPDAQGMELSVGPSIDKIQGIFQVLGIDEQTVGISVQSRVGGRGDELGETRESELQAAEVEALQAAMESVEVALALIKADLHSSVPDLSKEARSLTTSVEVLLNAFEPIDPDHFGKLVRLPVLIGQVEALQAEVDRLKESGDDKGKALAASIGFNTRLSENLHRIKTRLTSIKAINKANRDRKH